MYVIDTIIFDMDGLLIDSEPLWKEAAQEVLTTIGISLTHDEYLPTTGMRTHEFLEHFLRVYPRPNADIQELNKKITEKVTEKIGNQDVALQGAVELVKECRSRKLKVGIASSSPLSLIEKVVQQLDIAQHVDVLSSAEDLAFGKPHPQVFLDCAVALNSMPEKCLVFEDSFHGLIAAKAAKMKCIVVPAEEVFNEKIWFAADEKLKSLKDFTFDLLKENN